MENKVTLIDPYDVKEAFVPYERKYSKLLGTIGLVFDTIVILALLSYGSPLS